MSSTADSNHPFKELPKLLTRVRSVRVRFQLRTLLVVVTLCAATLAWFKYQTNVAERQRRIVAAIREAGGHISYNSEVSVGEDGSCYLRRKQTHGVPPWLIDRLGPDFFFTPVQARCGASNPNNTLELIAELDSLRSVSAHGRLSDSSLEKLARSQTLLQVNLSGATFGPAGIGHLAKLRELRTLGLSSSTFPFATLTDLGRAPSLETLSLTDSKVDDTSLAGLHNCHSLKHLLLHKTQIKGDGLRHLTHLKIESLSLGGSTVGDEGFEFIGQMSALKALEVQVTRVSDRGLSHLSGLHRLQILVLARNAITNSGIKHLSSLNSLEHLGLNSTQIDNDGLQHLATLVNLRHLHLADTKVDDEGFAYMNRVLPDCILHRPPR